MIDLGFALFLKYVPLSFATGNAYTKMANTDATQRTFSCSFPSIFVSCYQALYHIYNVQSPHTFEILGPTIVFHMFFLFSTISFASSLVINALDDGTVMAKFQTAYKQTHHCLAQRSTKCQTSMENWKFRFYKFLIIAKMFNISSQFLDGYHLHRTCLS